MDVDGLVIEVNTKVFGRGLELVGMNVRGLKLRSFCLLIIQH